VSEAQTVIEKRLDDGGFVRNPHVAIFVNEYTSQGVLVTGEVQRGGVYPLLGDRGVFDLITAAGFKFIRMDFVWSEIEQQKGVYDWSAYDELTANLDRRGIRAYYILDYSNPLYEETATSKNMAINNSDLISERSLLKIVS